MSTRYCRAVVGSHTARHPCPALVDWPTDPLRIIVPFAPGASTDIVARRIAPRLSELLGKPVVLENCGGAGGLVRAQAAVAAAPDGHTLFIATTSHSSLGGAAGEDDL